MPAVGFEPTTPEGERPQTHALDSAATGTGTQLTLLRITVCLVFLYSTKWEWAEADQENWSNC
jgi:hypothetical protein